MFLTSSTIAPLTAVGSTALVDPSPVTGLPGNGFAIVPFLLLIAALVALGAAVEVVHRRRQTMAGPEGGRLHEPQYDAAA